MYGGTRPSILAYSVWIGLSPRVRGNPERQQITPNEWIGRAMVYPRVYGGTGGEQCSALGLDGLSPRVRGNRQQRRPRRRRGRSIPACTGEPGPTRTIPSHTWVYPRVYGGTYVELWDRGAALGLSPRVRGNPLQQRRRRPAGRSIPACTGEPRFISSCGSVCRVYPRVYGGTVEQDLPQQLLVGLSPRVRGNRERQPCRLHL